MEEVFITPHYGSHGYNAMIDFESSEGHQESPQRLVSGVKSVVDLLSDPDLASFIKFEPDRLATYEEIGIVHSGEFVSALRAMEVRKEVDSERFRNVTAKVCFGLDNLMSSCIIMEVIGC